MWKANWEDTRQHFADWWDHKGLVVGGGSPPCEGRPHDDTAAPPEAQCVRDRYCQAQQRAERNHHALAQRSFPADTLPISVADIGPGSLALFMGSEPGFSKETVWFEPCMHEYAEPEQHPPLRFDDTGTWWRVTESTLRACAKLGRGRYLVGCPDLVENIDILAALRDPQTLMFDLIERPAWVEQKVEEINQAWFDAYRRIYDIIKLEDGSSAFAAFSLWGPGKTAKVQCDAAAMFSPEMFRRFVVPGLAKQCGWLDHSMFHLDGTQAMCHLDALLEIEALDAIEWTPQAGIERGGHPRWFELYRRILDAGKSVQAVGVAHEDIIPLLDAVGGHGVYILTGFSSDAQAEELAARVEPYR